jgi:hypothetical protein
MMLFHDQTNKLSHTAFPSGEWTFVHRGLKLFASHAALLELAAAELDAYYE